MHIYIYTYMYTHICVCVCGVYIKIKLHFNLLKIILKKNKIKYYFKNLSPLQYY